MTNLWLGLIMVLQGICCKISSHATLGNVGKVWYSKPLAAILNNVSFLTNLGSQNRLSELGIQVV